MNDEYRTPRRVGLDTAGRRGRAGGDRQRTEALQGTRREGSGDSMGGRNVNGHVRDRDDILDFVCLPASDPWGQLSHSRLDRPVGFDRSYRDTSGHPVRTQDRGPGDKGLMPNPVLVGCLIVLVITRAVQFIAGVFI